MSPWGILPVMLVLLSLGGETALAASQQARPTSDGLVVTALQLVQHGRFPEALEPLRQLHTSPLRSQLTSAWQRRLPFLLGFAYLQTGDYSKATLHFERVRESYPELKDYTLWYLGEGLRRLDRLAAARTAYQYLLDA